MPIANRLVLLASILSIAAGTGFSQDDVDLVDDLPKATKEAAAKGEKRAAKPRFPSRDDNATADSPPDNILPKIPGKSPPPPAERTTLIDDTALRHQGDRNAAGRVGAIPDKLSDALAIAMHNNPSILVAEAKLRAAQAELNQARQSVVHDLTVAYGRYSANKKGPIPAERMYETMLEVREDEAKIPYLLGVGAQVHKTADAHDGGKPSGRSGAMGPMGMGMTGMGPLGPGGMGGGAMGPGPMGPGGMSPMSGMGMGAMMRGGKSEQPPTEREGASELDPRFSSLPEKMRRFLETRVEMDFETVPLKEVLEYLKESAKAEVEFVILNPEEWELPEEMNEGDDESMHHPVTLHLKHVTIAAGLQALVDLFECAFVFRDYGILVLGPGQGLSSGGGTAGGMVDSYRAAGVPMIAPPPSLLFGAGMGGLGAGMGGMPGMPSGSSKPFQTEE